MKLEDFIYDPSLMLYLPLGELDGASFMSKDAYGYLCTATGATWRPDGRYFDRVDDIIDCGDKTQWNFGADSFSIEIYIKPEGTSFRRETILVIQSTNSDNEIWIGYGTTAWADDGTKITLSVNYDGATWGFDAIGATSVNDAYHHILLRKVGTSWKLYLNLIEEISQTYDFSPSNGTLNLGNNWNNDRDFRGTIGMVKINRPAITLLEAQRNYLSTKGRWK